ncbi:hypothetical protein QVD17_05224 [Tagetes erecta]|uniref:Uncharacterized protein n=1 Tax=Tagetes erecta TaxID=13708 RepID=A0AAD8LI58_TARER|nr:hypothetical protein QVD17_05224 [Tagetes erecta]
MELLLLNGTYHFVTYVIVIIFDIDLQTSMTIERHNIEVALEVDDRDQVIQLVSLHIPHSNVTMLTNHRHH